MRFRGETEKERAETMAGMVADDYLSVEEKHLVNELLFIDALHEIVEELKNIKDSIRELCTN